jgi:hypothetical protein
MVGDEDTIGIDYSSDVTHAPLVIAIVIELSASQFLGRNVTSASVLGPAA